jgi:hypothetical protein
MAKISQNYDDWNIPESTPTPTPKKRVMIELNDEVMREAKKSLREKGIKSEDVKNLPPIEELCKPIPHSSTIEVHSLQCFDNRDIPYSKPLDQCLDEFDNYIVKQDNFNKRVQNHLLENSRAIISCMILWREPPMMLECLLNISKWFRPKLISSLRCKRFAS